LGLSNVSAVYDGAQRLVPPSSIPLMGAVKGAVVIRGYNAMLETFDATIATGLSQLLKSPMVFFVFAK
jgi:hypothetical protein